MPKTKGNINVNLRRKYGVKFQVPNKEKSRRKTGKKNKNISGTGKLIKSKEQGK